MDPEKDIQPAAPEAAPQVEEQKPEEPKLPEGCVKAY
jgi:hypothetical protein